MACDVKTYALAFYQPRCRGYDRLAGLRHEETPSEGSNHIRCDSQLCLFYHILTDTGGLLFRTVRFCCWCCVADLPCKGLEDGGVKQYSTRIIVAYYYHSALLIPTVRKYNGFEVLRCGTTSTITVSYYTVVLLWNSTITTVVSISICIFSAQRDRETCFLDNHYTTHHVVTYGVEVQNNNTVVQ